MYDNLQEIAKNPELGLTNIFSSLKFSAVNGAAANTNIPITGIRKNNDQLIAVIDFEDLAVASGNVLVADRVAEANITSDGNVQLTTTSTSGNRLLIIWAKGAKG